MTKLKKEVSSGSGFVGGFKGGKIVQHRVSSGIPIKFQPDQEAILKFMGIQDISEFVDKDPGEALLLKFFDGKRVVSTGELFAFKHIKWEANSYYYLVNKGEIETKFNPMKDMEITELGQTGDILECSERINKTGKITLNDDSIASANYGNMYYPFNKKKQFEEPTD